MQVVSALNAAAACMGNAPAPVRLSFEGKCHGIGRSRTVIDADLHSLNKN